MTSITIRNVPQKTRDELAARAARSGRSLQEYLRCELIDLSERPDMSEWVREVREWRQRTGVSVSEEDILRFRDADRP